jgi:hypothetical protein
LLADGAYLSAWPTAAGLAPVVALAAGLGLGLWRPGYDPPEQIVFFYSAVTVAALLLVSAHGAGLGVLAWLGFGFGDAIWALGAPGHIANPALILVARAEADAQLGVALVALPLMARGLAKSAALQLGRPDWQAAPQAAIAFVMVFLWSQTTPVMLQAVYTWQGLAPRTHGLVQTSHSTGWMFALIAGYAAGVSAAMERAADRVPTYVTVRLALKAALTRAPRRPAALGGAPAILAQAALVVFMAGALVASWTEAIGLYIALAAVLAARRYLFVRLGLVERLAPGASPAVRLAITVVAVYLVCYVLLHGLSGQAAAGFHPALISMVLSALVAGLFAPRPAGGAA